LRIKVAATLRTRLTRFNFAATGLRRNKLAQWRAVECITDFYRFPKLFAVEARDDFERGYSAVVDQAASSDVRLNNFVVSVHSVYPKSLSAD
jgi:hypothetical protein